MDVKKGIKGLASLLEGLAAIGEVIDDSRTNRARRRAYQLANARNHQLSQAGRQRRVRALPANTRKKSTLKKHGISEDMVLKVANVHTLDQRVKYIQQMIKKGRNDPRIRALTVKIVSKKCGNKFCHDEKDHVSEIKAVFDWIRKNVRYVRDNYDRDTFQHPVRTLEFVGGDCDDYSITLASMLQSIGYPVKLRVIQTTNSSDWNHIYIRVGLPPGNPTHWMDLDGSENRPAGWAPPKSLIKRVKDYDA